MTVNASLAEFDQLTAPLMMAGLDLPASVERLQKSTQLAVHSLLGWSLTVRVDGASVTMTSMPLGAVAADVRASLRIPLSAFLTGDVDGGMVFYATEPHAFFHLAADFVAPVGPVGCCLRTDQDLNPSFTPGLIGAHLMSTINRAIGLMINRGDTAEMARMHLQAAARSAHLTLNQCAGALLSESLRPAWSVDSSPRRTFGVA